MSSSSVPRGADGEQAAGLSGAVSAIGFILAISYPVLAVSTGVRASYQLLLRQDITYLAPPLMSLLAAVCYLVAAVGFAYRRRWTWFLSVGMLVFETIMVLLVGTLSLLAPDLIGRTVWRHYGADYGYFPLIQPLLGLLWLFWPETLRVYGRRRAPAAPAPPP
jgi:hypothetical protein